MAASISAGFRTVAVGSVNGFSKTKPTGINLSVRGFDNTNFSTATLVWGKSASAPTTFAGFANPNVQPISDPSWYDRYSFQGTPGNTGSFDIAINGTLADAAWAAGDHVWVGLFTQASPSAGDTPVAVAGPFTVLA